MDQKRGFKEWRNRIRSFNTKPDVVDIDNIPSFWSFDASFYAFIINNNDVNIVDKLYAAVYYHRVKTKQQTKCVEKAGIEDKLHYAESYEEGFAELVKQMKSSGDDIIKDVYPLLAANYFFDSKPIVLDLCTKPESIKITEKTGVDNFEYIHASEYSVTKELTDLLKDISFHDERMKELYSTTKVKFLDSLWSDECCPDVLGLYTKIRNSAGEMVPQVWLFLNKIYVENEKYCDKRGIQGEGRKNALKYIIAYVYIHEMMHRYFDIRPDLNLKRSVPEIEEPMAEYATLKFCESFGDDDLLCISENMVKEKRNSRHYYALGYDLFKSEDVPSDLKEKYQRVSMIIHQGNDPVIDMFKSGVGVNSIINLINHYDEILQKIKDKETGK